MPEPGRRSVNRRAGPGGGAGPFRRAPRSRPSLHTPGTAAAGRRPAPPCALTRPQAKDEAAAGTDPRPGAALIAPRGADAALRTAAPRPQQPRSGRLRPGPAPSHLSRCSPPPAAQMAPYLFSPPCRPSLPHAAGASHMGGIRAGLS